MELLETGESLVGLAEAIDFMDPEAEYLYRGSTLGWAGTRVNRTLPMTCTSTDPLVATLFALECLFHGHAVVHFVLKSVVSPFIGPSNFFDHKELAVNLQPGPLEFLQYVSHSIDADDAREILWSIGFEQVPTFIYGLDLLNDELSLKPEGYRLSPEQVIEFNRRAFEVSS